MELLGKMSLTLHAPSGTANETKTTNAAIDVVRLDTFHVNANPKKLPHMTDINLMTAINLLRNDAPTHICNIKVLAISRMTAETNFLDSASHYS